MRPDGIFINEWQLNSSLNQAVQQGHRSDFGLLLSMMVQDVRFHGSFQLEKTPQGEPLPLRQRLELPSEAPLLGYFVDEPSRSKACAEAFHQGGLVQSRLQHCLQPEPVDIQGVYPHGLTAARANVEPAVSQIEQVTEQMKVLPAQIALADLIAQQRLCSMAIKVAA